MKANNSRTYSLVCGLIVTGTLLAKKRQNKRETRAPYSAHINSTSFICEAIVVQDERVSGNFDDEKSDWHRQANKL